MACFEEALKETRPQFESVSAEVMLEIPRATEPELVYRIYRMDIMAKTPEGPKAIEVNVDPIEPRVKALTGFGVPISLSPVVWNGIEFAVTGRPPLERDLLLWASGWLDIEDKRQKPNEDFQSVIHNVLRPECERQKYFLSVDFGSASPEAVHELIALLSPTAQAIQIGSGLRD